MPRLAPIHTLEKKYSDYLSSIPLEKFQGEIRTDYATRLSVATDNSIYQVIPQAVIFPKTSQDIALLFKLSYQPSFRSIQFSPRGGGTGANGQSLTSGIIIDCSKYMRDILELNIQEQSVRVQPGVVLDQLNEYLKPHGYYFAPQVSTSNRATIGGMVNTDACGNGSRLLGRTRDHVIQLTYVSTEGEIIQSKAITTDGLSSPMQREIYAILLENQGRIHQAFKQVPRTLNGYNLLSALNETKNILNLNALLCGSEGTLAVITECQLKLTPIPTYKKMIVIQYRDFDDALRAKEITADISPAIIETLDEKLMELARQDRLYHSIKNLLNDHHAETQSINLVEFTSNDACELEKNVSTLCRNIQNSTAAIGYYVTKNSSEADLFWELRKKSVGLISQKMVDSRRPIPFIEDTAVPPAVLADYIAELKALLDSYGLVYGMYGHVDAGCVHVRPALDMTLSEDENLIRELSDQVVMLIEKFGGVLWGEHGMGYRCGYAEKFFGPELYLAIRKIKTLFDPYHQLNPGKIAVPLSVDTPLVKLEDDLRGYFDQHISRDLRQAFAVPVSCNGNGACFNVATTSVMCPSYKVTRERIHSPKGRSVLLREWLRQLSLRQTEFNKKKSYHFIQKIFFTIQKKLGKKDFSHEVYQAMHGCLSCKACTTQCPLNIDIPDVKSRFLFHYHQRYLRSVRDYLISSVERIALWQSRFPVLSSRILAAPLVKSLAKKWFGMCDIPHQASKPMQWDVDLAAFQTLSGNKVILLQDVFTTVYDQMVLTDFHAFLKQLGYQVFVLPLFENGKPWHTKGFLKRFEKIAQNNMNRLNQLSALHIPIVGIDPSMTLTYRDEYAKLFPANELNVQLPQEFLQQCIPLIEQGAMPSSPLEKYYLFLHCTEQSACVHAEAQWQAVFHAAHIDLTVLKSGCCGMAGSYGHEVEHYVQSRQLFAMDWQRYITANGFADEYCLATGYSCRSQAKRLSGIRLRHPIEVLLKRQKK